MGMDGGKRVRRDDGDEDAEDAPLPTSSLFLSLPEARTVLRPEHIGCKAIGRIIGVLE